MSEQVGITLFGEVKAIAIVNTRTCVCVRVKTKTVLANMVRPVQYYRRNITRSQLNLRRLGLGLWLGLGIGLGLGLWLDLGLGLGLGSVFTFKHPDHSCRRTKFNVTCACTRLLKSV